MSVQSIKSASNVRKTVSAEEWKARTELAACHRLLAHFGVNDLTYNHLSVRVPGEPGQLLIKSRSMMFEEVTASNLLKYELDGKPLQDGPPLGGGGLVIHGGILSARPDINAVFHTHTPANIGVAAQKQGLMMISQHSIMFYGRLSYHDFGGFEFNLDQREPLVRGLGPKNRVAILRNHGALVCGRTLAEAFVEHHFLETACRGQIAALAGGSEVNLIPEDVCRSAARQLDSASGHGAGMKDWDACMRLAYKLDPAFMD